MHKELTLGKMHVTIFTVFPNDYVNKHIGIVTVTATAELQNEEALWILAVMLIHK